ncbi:hypothetical protein FA13DRAFT_1804799 [Coprinellus micaceus]|uniref:Fungal-type protein kinase domain-containing protein n=1 Tax=Coprinellus micaceus TaxID=71717 RepID=A0A4Y7S4C7_COPMI|nr:hypothetical protein FA13DRAFT_1804799 [Coprinellus micaceus]
MDLPQAIVQFPARQRVSFTILRLFKWILTDLGYEETLLALFQQLENEIGTNIHLGVDLSKFSQEVWGLDKEIFDKVLAMPMALEKMDVEKYRECTKDDDLHKSFLDISGQLLRDVSKELGDEENETFTDTFWDRLLQNPASRSRQSVPDVVNTWKPLPPAGATPSLSTAKSVFELKRIPREKEKQEEEDIEEVDEKDEEDADVRDGAVRGEEDNDDNDESKPTPSSKKDADSQRSLDIGVSKRTASTLKRSFDSVKDADDEDGGSPKKQRCGDETALKNSLLPLYATDAMASSSRYYVVGVVVDRFAVTVCYFDRFLVTCVASFSFEEEPSKLALTLYAMNRCDRLRAGFDPHLQPAADNESGKTRPVENIIGSIFEYPDTPSSSGTCLRVSGVIRQPDELIGRATAVYKVRRRLADGSFSEEEYVYKLSWPSKTRLSEIEVVEILKERLPKDAHDHLPDVTFTRTLTAEDLKLPWLRLGLDLTSDNHKERVLRGMMGKFYHKLWEAGSIENFKRAWLDCVECLYLARKLGKVLHRDLSESNLMVLKCLGGEVKGVLNDWDMAKFLDREDDDPSTDEHRTGTLPFMAFNLVIPKPSPHWFRHDLESLLWILLWAALHYNLEEGTRDAVTHPSLRDLTTSLDANWRFKAAFLTYSPLPLREIRAGVKPEFTDLFEEWIEPLRELFVDGMMMNRRCNRDGKDCDEVTYNGIVTFKSFMEAIKVTPRTWGIPNFLAGTDDF